LSMAAFCLVSSSAQDFQTLWNDPDANFYTIKAAAREYFKDKDQGLETDYSRYMRWESFVEPRVYPSGDLSLLNSENLFNEIRLFESATPKLKSQPNWIELPVDKYDNIAGHWSPGVGRIDRMAVDPTNAEIIYAGAPSGGLLKSIDRGQTWRAMGDRLPTMGVSGIAINPQNPQQIFISSGDGDGGYTYTSGVFRSDDGGENWEMTGFEVDLTSRKNSKDLIMNPQNPDILFISTSIGLYKTVDNGQNWYKVKNGQFDDLCFKPGDPETVYASTFTGFYASYDGGETFEKNDVSVSGRVLISVSPADPEAVFLATGQQGTFKSFDSGRTFSAIGELPFDSGTHGYMFAFAVSPTDTSEMHVATMNLFSSTDGGRTWNGTTWWTWNNDLGYTHCDYHDLAYHGDTLFTCTDGGLSYSTDKAETWTVCFDNANCTQIYNIAVCKSNPDMYMWCAQDNGVYHFDSKEWWAWLGADGMDAVYDYSDPNTRYGCVQNGQYYCNSHPISQPGKGAWVTPCAIHPTNPDILYVGNDKVRRSLDGMRNWQVIGSFGGDSYIQAMAVAESNPDFIFASKGSKIWRTINGGEFWTEISDGLPDLSITRIAVHPRNERVIAVSFSGYTSGRKVFLSYDAGLNWINYSKNLPNLPAGGLAFDDKWNNALYVGMDVGLYYIDNQQEEWSAYGEGLPNVIVRDIEIHHRSEQIFIGTHGRGMWKTSTKPYDSDLQYCPGSGQVESQAAYIKQVFLGDIESFSDDDEYLEVTDQYSVIERGRYYPIEIYLSSAEYEDSVLAWIDWNNNYEFEESESLALSAPDTNNVVMGMISVPENAEMQMTRLRLRSTQNKAEFFTACGNYPGEVEDYQLLVTASPVSYCPVISKNVRNEFIREVEFSDMKSRTNGYDYSDYSSFRSANVHRGETYSIRLKPEIKKDTVTQRWRVWIDYDMNGDFNGENEMVVSEGSKEEIMSTVTIPDDAVFGFTMMRIMMQRGETPIPCEDITYGEVEDYGVNIKPHITSVDNLQIINANTPELVVYPNPSQGIFNISINSLNASKLRLNIVNSLGQVVIQKSISARAGDTTERLDLSMFENGLYYIFVITPEGHYTQARLIKQ
ncbi:MAG: T9SS type A sorting domain-containing protein, partial [Bacteroidales bacterium]|nr:T9SS type A sorting domain-containing protein [Bacteroidales bacterium]